MELTIKYAYNGRFSKDTDIIITDSIPRVGEYFCVQYWSCPIYRVEYRTIQLKLKATIYVDVSQTECGWDLI